MATSARSSIIWMFASFGGAVPLISILVHLVRKDALDLLDLIFWPASFLISREPIMSSPAWLGLFLLAALLNILWYMVLGWVVSLFISPFRR